MQPEFHESSFLVISCSKRCEEFANMLRGCHACLARGISRNDKRTKLGKGTWGRISELVLERTCSLWQAERGSRQHPRNKLRESILVICYEDVARRCREETAVVEFVLIITMSPHLDDRTKRSRRLAAALARGRRIVAAFADIFPHRGRDLQRPPLSITTSSGLSRVPAKRSSLGRPRPRNDLDFVWECRVGR